MSTPKTATMSHHHDHHPPQIPTESSMQILDTRHGDFIHHLAFDSYGRRMATCSADRYVRVWTLAEDGEWQCTTEFQAHRGTVSQLDWCHAEFGSLIATGGNDMEAKVWTMDGNCKTKLTDARKEVTCLEFAPRQFGLQLATGSADGVCRIYEAVDLQNLSHWPLQGSMTAFSHGGISCLSWCNGRFEPPTIVLGGSTHLVIWRYHSQNRQWSALLQFPKHAGTVLDVAWAPNVGRRFHWIAAAEQGGPLRVYKLERESLTSLESTQLLEQESSSWKVQWNVTGTVLAASGDAGIVQLWKSDLDGTWKCVTQIHGEPPMEG